MTRHGRRSRSRSPPSVHPRRAPSSSGGGGNGNRSSHNPSSSSYQPGSSTHPHHHYHHSDFAAAPSTSSFPSHRSRQPSDMYPTTASATRSASAARGRSRTRSRSRSTSRSRTLSRSRSRSRSPMPSSAPGAYHPSSSSSFSSAPLSRNGGHTAHGGFSSRSAYGNHRTRSTTRGGGGGQGFSSVLSASSSRYRKSSRSRSPRRPPSSSASSHHGHGRSKSRDRDMYMVTSPTRSRRGGRGSRGEPMMDEWGVYDHARPRLSGKQAHRNDRRSHASSASASTGLGHARESASEDGELVSPTLRASAPPPASKSMRPPTSTRPTSSSSLSSSSTTSTTKSVPPTSAQPAASAPVPAEPTGPEEYETLAQVGEGTYGKVFRARQRRTGTLVALKRVRIEATRDGFPITAVRELQLLQRISSANVVSLLDIALETTTNGTTPGVGGGGGGHAPTYVYMVFEYMQHDLAGILHHPSVKFTLAHVKSLVQQLLLGLAFLHRRGIVHRDVKGSNLLLNRSGQLKLADFGLARAIVPHGQSAANTRAVDLTNRVITLWYRPPELLLGGTQYGGEVDLWSTGCILLELFVSRPAFPGTDELSQLDLVFRTCGTPDARAWPDVENLPWWPLVRPAAHKPRRLLEVFADSVRQAFPEAPAEGVLELMDALLQVTPDKRPTAEAALGHKWFVSEAPKPEPPRALLEGLDDGDHWHEFESKQRKRAAARAAAAAQQQQAHVSISGSGDAMATPVAASSSVSSAATATNAPAPPGSPVHVVTSVRVPKLPLAEPVPSAVSVASAACGAGPLRTSSTSAAANAAARQTQLRNTRKSFVPTGALISFAFMSPPVVPAAVPPSAPRPTVVDEVAKHVAGHTVQQAVTPSSPGTPAVSLPARNNGGGGSARPASTEPASVQIKPGGIVVRQVRPASFASNSPLDAPSVPPPPSSRSSSPPELSLRGGTMRTSLADPKFSSVKRARLMSPPAHTVGATAHKGPSLASALGFPLPPIAPSQASSPVVGGSAGLRSPPPPLGSKRV